MALPAILGSIAGGLASGAGSALLGGLLGSSADNSQRTTENAPWEGLVPYLIGTGALPSYLTQTPDLYLPWLNWAQGLGEGNLAATPPPMMIDYVRAQQGIGTTDGKPASESDRVSSMPKGSPTSATSAAPALPNLYQNAQGQVFTRSNGQPGTMWGDSTLILDMAGNPVSFSPYWNKNI